MALLRSFFYIFIFYREKSYKHLIQEIFHGGAVCIKLSQWASQRKGFLPLECARILESTCMDVPSHDHSITLELLEKTGIAKHCTDVEQKLLGSGSIAQVVRTTFKNKQCVIKAVHPGIPEQITVDVFLLENAVNILRYFIGSYLTVFDSRKVFRNISMQANLKLEAKNTWILRQCFRNNDLVHFAKIYYRSTNILIENYLPGEHLPEFRIKHPDREVDAKVLTIACYLEMFLVHGIVHADCHYGNIKYFVNSNNEVEVCFLDCGVVGKITPEKRDHLKDIIRYLAYNDIKRMCKSVRALSTRRINNVVLTKVIKRHVTKLRKESNKTANTVSKILHTILNILFECNICIDGDLVSFMVGYCIIEGTTSIKNKYKNSLTRATINRITNDDRFKTLRRSANFLLEALNAINR